jgi:ERCC4-type nuclease
MKKEEFIYSLIFVVDTREKLPYLFDGRNIERYKLDTGDYSIKGLEDKIAIERKSIDDLIGTITKGRETFEKELERSTSLEYFGIVVECSLSNLAKGQYTSKMKPKAAVQTLVSYSVRYNMHLIFADNRAFGQRMTESLLEKFAINHQFRETK